MTVVTGVGNRVVVPNNTEEKKMTLEEAQGAVADSFSRLIAQEVRGTIDGNRATRLVMFGLFSEAVENVRAVVAKMDTQVDDLIHNLSEFDQELLQLNLAYIRSARSPNATSQESRDRRQVLKETLDGMRELGGSFKEEVKKTKDLTVEAIGHGANQAQGLFCTVVTNLYDARMKELGVIGEQFKTFGKALDDAQKRNIKEKMQVLREEREQFGQMIKLRQQEDASWRMRAEQALASQKQEDETALARQQQADGHANNMAKIKMEGDKIIVDANVRSQEIHAQERTKVVEAITKSAHPSCVVM